MTSPCKSIVDEAKRKMSFFSKDDWSAALLLIKAAECFLSEGNNREAMKNALKAADLLKKLSKKADVGTVLPDLEKALKLAYNAAEDEKTRKKIGEDLFGTIMLRAQMAITSGDYSAAALHYKKAIEYAPTGKEARLAIERAIANLGQLAEKKMSLGMDKQASRIMSLVEDFKALLEVSISEEVKATLKQASVRVVMKSGSSTESIKEGLLSLLNELGFSSVQMNDYIDHVEFSASKGSVSLVIKVGKSESNIVIEATSTLINELIDELELLKSAIIDKIEQTKIMEQQAEGEINKNFVIAYLNKLKEQVLLGAKYNIVLSNILMLSKLIKDKKLGSSKYLEEILEKYKHYQDSLLNLEETEDFVSAIDDTLGEIK